MNLDGVVAPLPVSFRFPPVAEAEGAAGRRGVAFFRDGETALQCEDAVPGSLPGAQEHGVAVHGPEIGVPTHVAVIVAIVEHADGEYRSVQIAGPISRLINVGLRVDLDAA